MDTDCENVFRTSNHCREASNFQKFVKMRHSFIVFLLECVKKSVADVDDGFGDRTPVCREFSPPSY